MSFANDWVNYIYCDSEGLIWLGHYKGVKAVLIRRRRVLLIIKRLTH